MVRELIHQMLGQYGDNLLVFVTGNSAALALFLCLWFAVMLAGKWQLRRIEMLTVDFVTRQSAEAYAANPRLTTKQLFKLVYPRWAAQLRQWGWYVPHRWELWPVPVRPETVQRAFQFTPAWLQQVLHEHGIEQHGRRHGR